MLLYQSKFGSQVYGTALPTSDIDVGKVLLEPREQIFGIEKDVIIAQKIEGGFDTREMYLKRFIKLCVDGNPNVMEWLFTPKSHIDFVDPTFQLLVLNKPLLYLQSDKLIAAHLGFAKSQIIKMRKHEQEMGAKRKELYAKFGYDVKYASHAIRLVKQLIELLLEGTISYPFPDYFCEQLKAIKLGQVSLEEFDKQYATWVKLCEDVIKTPKMHKIPEKCDYRKIAKELEIFYCNKFDLMHGVRVF